MTYECLPAGSCPQRSKMVACAHRSYRLCPQVPPSYMLIARANESRRAQAIYRSRRGRSVVIASSFRCLGRLATIGQIDQPMGNDLSCFLDQFADDLTGRLDVMDQADSLSCQQIHGVDVSRRVAVGRNPHEAQHRERPFRDDGLANHRLVWTRFLATSFPAEPLLDKRCP